MRFVIAIGVLWLFPAVGMAQCLALSDDCTLSWDAATSGPAAAGYRLYWGATPGDRTRSFDAGTALTARCSAIGINAPAEYHVVVRAYDASARESSDSNEVCLTLGPPFPPTLRVGP